MAPWGILPYHHHASLVPNPPIASTDPYHRGRRHSFHETKHTSSDPFHIPVPPAPPRHRSSERPARSDGGSSLFKEIARTTIEAINNGIADINSTKRRTRLYLEDAPELSHWRSKEHRRSRTPVEMSILPLSAVKAARSLYLQHPHRKIGILNFASATMPAGRFMSGSNGQEQSIARSSTLYTSLSADAAQLFYRLHASDQRGGFYTHSIIYSPDIYLFRDDNGDWFHPLRVDVLSSSAVNAGQVRKKNHWKPPAEVDAAISSVMRERMGRILALFEREGVKQLVLGSFGTGAFQNSVHEIARLWYELLRAPGAPYALSFDYVVFAIPDFSTQQKFARGMTPVMINGSGGWAL